MIDQMLKKVDMDKLLGALLRGKLDPKELIKAFLPLEIPVKLKVVAYKQGKLFLVIEPLEDKKDEGKADSQ